MGCDDTREDIEEKMLYTRLEREEIRKQKKLLMEELKLSTGHKIKKEKIPDFVDVEYIREKKQKHYEKMIKEEVKRVEEEERKKEKEREELKKEMEQQQKDEELLYMPLETKIHNPDHDLEDIYYLNYVLDKKQKKPKEKSKERKHKRGKTKKKTKKEKNKEKVHLSESESEGDDKEDKKDKEDKYDFIEPIDAKIRTKVGSPKSILENKNMNQRIINKNIDNYDDDSSESESKNKPYLTPHLQPND